jgi:hypothetical protein
LNCADISYEASYDTGSQLGEYQIKAFEDKLHGRLAAFGRPLESAS